MSYMKKITTYLQTGPSRGEGRKVFRRASRRSVAPLSLKNTGKGVPGGFFLTSNMHKIGFRTPLGELTMLPQTPSRMVREHSNSRPIHIIIPLGA